MVTLSGATRVNAIAISTDRSDDARAWVVGDGGKVWTGVAPYTSWGNANVAGAGRLNGVACTTTQQAVVVAGEGGGIWKTTNNGGLWTSCSPVGSSGVNFYSVSQNPNGTSHFMAVGSGNSAYRSSDGALTWAEMSPFDGGSSTVPLDAGGEYSTPHALKMLSPYVAYIGTLNGQVRRTANGGATWQWASGVYPFWSGYSALTVLGPPQKASEQSWRVDVGAAFQLSHNLGSHVETGGADLGWARRSLEISVGA